MSLAGSFVLIHRRIGPLSSLPTRLVRRVPNYVISSAVILPLRPTVAMLLTDNSLKIRIAWIGVLYASAQRGVIPNVQEARWLHGISRGCVDLCLWY